MHAKTTGLGACVVCLLLTWSPPSARAGSIEHVIHVSVDGLRPDVITNLGAANLPKAFYEGLKTFSKRDLPLFKTREEALAWLLEEP